VNDISATLISPSGTEVQLFTNPCSSANLQNIIATFDDAGAAPTCGANPAIAGTIAPVGSLSSFVGQDALGAWTLVIDDAFDQDGGSINSWSLNICTTQPLGVQQSQSFDLAVYPNPNNGSFNVQFNAADDNVVVSVHDIRGRKIFEKSFAGNGVFNENLQLNSAEAGVYLVSVQNGNRKEVKKVVIQ
ncbi:MAG: T9SS type A sorting domain-containing protein, partial [Flavobacterium sp.]